MNSKRLPSIGHLVELKSDGYIRLEIRADMFKVSTEDRAFIMSVIEAMSKYEEMPAAQGADE